jgi:hypothetical protein
VEPPPADGEAAVFDAGVELVTALDDAAVKAAIALNGAGVGVVVGTVRRVPGVGDGVAKTIGAGLEVETVAYNVAMALTVGFGC